MQRYDIDHKGIRTGWNGDFKWMETPVLDKNVTLYILVMVEDLKNVVKLFPEVETLKLEFCTDHPYDLSCLLNLKKLKSLFIEKWCENHPFKLLNLADLRKLNLEKLTLFGTELDPLNPEFSWPKIMNPKFKHIDSINTIDTCGSEKPQVTTYNIRWLKMSPSQKGVLKTLTEDKYWDCSGTPNILVQKISCNAKMLLSTFQIFYHNYSGEFNGTNELCVKELTKSQFTKLVGKNPPKSNEDLWIEDIN